MVQGAKFTGSEVLELETVLPELAAGFPAILLS